MRAETGPMKFGDDWTGVFIRGDNAGAYAMALRALMQMAAPRFDVGINLQSLLRVLEGSDERTSHLSDTQVMKPFEHACEQPSRDQGIPSPAGDQA